LGFQPRASAMRACLPVPSNRSRPPRSVALTQGAAGGMVPTMTDHAPYLLIDNYDSFTYNLWHFLGELGAEVIVHRNDKISVAEAMGMGAAGIILSPGPCDPD